MRYLSLILLFCCLAGAQTSPVAPAAAELPDDAVLATIGGNIKFTYGELKALMDSLSAEQRQLATRNPKAFLQQYALLRKLAKLAEEDKLDQKSPVKEALENARTQILVNAKLADAMNNSIVQPNEITRFYSENKERFRQVKVQAIYIAFGSAAAAKDKTRKPLTEAEAKAKALKLLAQIRSGADFTKLVKEHSDDSVSAAKDGDFGSLRTGDNMPEAIRKAVFSLKEGETSEPIQQSGGFYLLRAKEVGYRALSECRDEIFSELKQAQYKRWLDEVSKSVEVKVVNEAFFATPEAQSAPAAPAPKTPPAK